MTTELPARLNKSDYLVDLFLGNIQSGQWPAGSRIPSERELARSCASSRTSIREALKVLQLVGAIETRYGDGSFVAEAPAVAENDIRIGLSGNIVHSLPVREVLEISGGILGMRRAAPSDRAKLTAAVLEMEEMLADEDFGGYLRATFDLHEIIARASRNPFVVETTQSALTMIRSDESLLSTRYNSEIAKYSLEVHQKMASAFLQGSMDDYVAAVYLHYEEYPVLCGPASQQLIHDGGAN